jgi:hypothetical protein
VLRSPARFLQCPASTTLTQAYRSFSSTRSPKFSAASWRRLEEMTHTSTALLNKLLSSKRKRVFYAIRSAPPDRFRPCSSTGVPTGWCTAFTVGSVGQSQVQITTRWATADGRRRQAGMQRVQSPWCPMKVNLGDRNGPQLNSVHLKGRERRTSWDA